MYLIECVIELNHDICDLIQLVLCLTSRASNSEADNSSLETTQEEVLIRLLAAIFVLSSIFTSTIHANNHKPHHIKHHRCITRACYHRVAEAWRKKHPRPKPSPPLEASIASWYGPADSGGSLACTGETLTSSTMGVANKTLPCGTRVHICLERSGPCIDTRVVDRGPYIAGRDWDLTEATARAIGFLSRGVGTIYVAIE